MDSRGHELEHAWFDPDGGTVEEIVTTYGDWGPAERRYSEGAAGTTRFESWAYDARGRLREYTDAQAPNSRTERTFYLGESAAIDHVEIVANGRTRLKTYSYEGGRLVGTATTSGDPDCGIPDRMTLLYWPSGVLQREAFSHTSCRGPGSLAWDREYDERGRLVSESSSNENSGSSFQYVYLGDLLVSASEVGHTQGLTRYDYDEHGRLMRRRTATDDLRWATRTRSTTRYVYACGTSDVVQVETDSDEDAVPDVVETLERDARGNVVTDRFFGPGVRSPTRTTNTYDCFE